MKAKKPSPIRRLRKALENLEQAAFDVAQCAHACAKARPSAHAGRAFELSSWTMMGVDELNRRGGR